MRLARLATPVFEEDYPFEIGKANVLREGTDAAVFACGLMVSETLAAARLLEAGVNDQFGQSGKAADVLREYGLTADQIADRIRETL